MSILIKMNTGLKSVQLQYIPHIQNKQLARDWSTDYSAVIVFGSTNTAT